MSSKISSRGELLRKTVADCARSGKLINHYLLEKSVSKILDDALVGVDVVQFYYLFQLRNFLCERDFVVAVTMTHNCVEFLENSKLYQYLGMRVANAEQD